MNAREPGNGGGRNLALLILLEPAAGLIHRLANRRGDLLRVTNRLHMHKDEAGALLYLMVVDGRNPNVGTLEGLLEIADFVFTKRNFASYENVIQ